MFSVVYETLRTNDESVYIERLDALFSEFAELKYLVDEPYEKNILMSLIFNLTAVALCRKSMYVETIWKRTYGDRPFDAQASSEHTSRDYADQIARAMEKFANTKACELELIHLLICYTKCKGYSLTTMLGSFIAKY